MTLHCQFAARIPGELSPLEEELYDASQFHGRGPSGSTARSARCAGGDERRSSALRLQLANDRGGLQLWLSSRHLGDLRRFDGLQPALPARLFSNLLSQWRRLPLLAGRMAAVRKLVDGSLL